MVGVAWAMLVGDSKNEPYMFAVAGVWLLYREPYGEWIGQSHLAAAAAHRTAVMNTKIVETGGGRIIRGPMEVEVDETYSDNFAIWTFDTGRLIQRALWAKQ